MSLMGNAFVCIHSVSLIMIMLYYTIRRMDWRLLSNRLHVLFFLVTAGMLLVDLFSRFDGPAHAAHSAVNHIFNFLLFAGQPMLPIMWLVYVVNIARRGRVATRRAVVAGALFAGLNLALLLASLFTGWFYTIGADNVYSRGPLYPLSVAMLLIPLVVGYMVVLRNRKNIEARIFYPLLLFPVPPVIGAAAQLLFYGMPFMLNAMVISLLILSLFVQERSVYTDALTGAGNRRQLDAVLHEKIRRCSRGRTFSIILLDIDNLKTINDGYGHEAGDRLLVLTAQMLRQCVRSVDYVMRYGGDEFVIIADISDEAGLATLIQRIHAWRRRMNAKSASQLQIHFSLGSAVYACESNESADELLKRVDKLMYEDKGRKKCGAAD
jgi:diguanylate cyclase (GGDEF)-like protein